MTRHYRISSRTLQPRVRAEAERDRDRRSRRVPEVDL